MINPTNINIFLVTIIVLLAFASILKKSIVINNNLQYQYGEKLEEEDE